MDSHQGGGDGGGGDSGGEVKDWLENEVEAEEAGRGEREEHQSVEQSESHFTALRRWERNEIFDWDQRFEKMMKEKERQMGKQNLVGKDDR